MSTPVYSLVFALVMFVVSTLCAIAGIKELRAQAERIRHEYWVTYTFQRKNETAYGYGGMQVNFSGALTPQKFKELSDLIRQKIDPEKQNSEASVIINNVISLEP